MQSFFLMLKVLSIKGTSWVNQIFASISTNIFYIDSYFSSENDVESEDGSASSGVDEDDVSEAETESEIDSPVKVNKTCSALQIIKFMVMNRSWSAVSIHYD